MDPIGTSCFSLNVEENARAILEQKRQDERFQEIIVSCGSLSRYDARKTKTLIPQIIAASIAASFHIVVGFSLAYSAILLPQLETRDQNGTNNTTKDDFTITKGEGAWIASVIVLAVPIGAPIGGFIMDSIGRLNTVKLAAIPGVIGWILIALSYNLPMLLIGRFFTGFASALGTGPAIVYLTEIARADMRGSLISLAPAYTSLGMVLAYLKGWILGWRAVAWMCNCYTIIPMLLLFLIPESPAWLVSKNRHTEALKSLNWINKYQPQPENKAETLAEMQLALLQKEHRKKLEAEAKTGSGFTNSVRCFLKPTGYKPLLILFGLFFFQQFSGIYITLFYSIDFFEEVGSKVNPYLASVMLGTIRCLMSIVNTYMLRTYRRRPLIAISATGMAICMTVSGLFTMWIKQGTTSLNWIPVAAICMYVLTSMIGLLSIPWTMTAELFPIEIRGVAHSFVNAIANLLMFFSVQSYNTLMYIFNGAAGVQWFFAAISIGGMIYSIIFLPETHGLKLSEITDYFNHNTIYLGQSKKKNKRKQTVPKQNGVSRATPKDIVKSPNGQNEKLINDEK